MFVQRGTNENTNGPLRHYFLVAVAAAVNGRPRKMLEWKTPAEALDEHLLLIGQAGVATTG
jgi:IS30 family transposase